MLEIDASVLKSIESQSTHSLFHLSYLDLDAAPRIYDEIENLTLLADKITQYIEEYNELHSKKPVDMVTFLYIIQHISRVCRILQQPKVNWA